MKKSLLLVMLLAAFATMGWAQDRSVSGKVTSDLDGTSLPGVNVLIMGTTEGVVTDMDGNYRISVPEGATLRFSYIGFVDVQVPVGNQSVIDVPMREDVTELSEIVVTALGVTRSSKALNYAITEVDGDEFTEARENNLSNALVGRIAGVNVSNVASGPAGSSRVIIRGNKSLNGNNQPLYVVDGIPMDNSNFGNAGIWGGNDQGDGMTSINPDDIATITVLKGANAAALYGARAANGVINITTKSGKSTKGIGVEFNSNYVIETINDQRELQREYGQGGYQRVDPLDPDSPYKANAPSDIDEAYNWNTSSWGPAFTEGGNFINILGDTKPYKDAGDQWDKYYGSGQAWTNTLALTGGNAEQNFRLSVSDLRSESVVPNSGFDRFNASLSANSKFGKRLTANAKLLYSHEDVQNRPYLSDSPMNGLLSMYYLPANSDIEWYKGDPDKPGAVAEGTDPALLAAWAKEVGEELPAGNHNWHQNPYWTTEQWSSHDVRDRLIGSGLLRYDFTDWLYAQGRVGMDWYTRRDQQIVPQGTSYQRGGSMNERERRVREINAEWIVGLNDQYGPISVNAFVGGNWMRRKSETLNLSGNGFNVPFEEWINNTVTRSWGYGISESGINSLFGSAEIGYNGYLYLTATARQDWFSVLNPDNNSILYPSVGLSYVFSDHITTMPSWFSFGKARVSWAQVGNVTVSPYSVNTTYSLNGNTHNGYTMAQFSSGGTIPNPGLLPLLSTETEFGFDLRFLENRVGADITYYMQETTDDILNATISRASGFNNTTVNVGRLTNKGLEILLYGSPVQGETMDIEIYEAKSYSVKIDVNKEIDKF